MSHNSHRFPFRVLFVTTSMPVGGAETLLVNLVRRMDRRRFAPELVCLKELGPLGEELAAEIPVHSRLLANKWDLRVLPRMLNLMRRPPADAVITVGAGDKMFWGRLAARWRRVPVVCSALHSTGWPDEVSRLNRLLTPWTDAFIGVADGQSKFIAKRYGFPLERVHTIYNGVDVERFAPHDATATRRALKIAVAAPLVGIVAALRPEKNHELFLAGASQIADQLPSAQFLVIGDGTRREPLEKMASGLGLADRVHFLGSRTDIPQLLAACDLLALTSHNEASPVSILEALSAGCAVVAADVGSVGETIVDQVTGRLFAAGDLDAYVAACVDLLRDPGRRRQLAIEGRRRVVEKWSLDSMVRGYEELIIQLHARGSRSPGASPLNEGERMTKTPRGLSPG